MQNEANYSIGAVAKLIDISPHALRKWEDRYGAIRPSRSAGGDRRYSAVDVDRLTKLKRLVDRGHPISTLAPLQADELDHLLARSAAAGHPAQRPATLAVIGERVAHDLRRAEGRLPGVDLIASAAALDGVAEVDADVVLVELGSLGTDTRAELSRLRTRTGVARVIVVYGYGSIDAAEQLSDATTALVRRPLNHRELARTIVALAGTSVAGPPALGLPPHRFSRDVLAAMAMIAPELACECPRHVGQLLIELTDFENYSADCENTKPADAAVHNMLRKTAATSRALFENALVQLAHAEGIDLDKVGPQTGRLPAS